MHVFALHTCIHTCPSARDVLAKGKIEKARHRVDLGLDVVEEAFTVDLYKSLHCQCLWLSITFIRLRTVSAVIHQGTDCSGCYTIRVSTNDVFWFPSKSTCE